MLVDVNARSYHSRILTDSSGSGLDVGSAQALMAHELLLVDDAPAATAELDCSMLHEEEVPDFHERW